MGIYRHFTDAELQATRPRLMASLQGRLTAPTLAAHNGRSVQYQQNIAKIRKDRRRQRRARPPQRRGLAWPYLVSDGTPHPPHPPRAFACVVARWCVDVRARCGVGQRPGDAQLEPARRQRRCGPAARPRHADRPLARPRAQQWADDRRHADVARQHRRAQCCV